MLTTMKGYGDNCIRWQEGVDGKSVSSLLLKFQKAMQQRFVPPKQCPTIIQQNISGEVGHKILSGRKRRWSNYSPRSAMDLLNLPYPS